MTGWQWHQLHHMHIICTLPVPHHSIFLQDRCSSWCTSNSVKALKATNSRNNIHSTKVRQRSTINHLSHKRIIKFNTDTLTELTLVTERHRPLDQTDSWVDSHTGSLFYCSNNNKTVMMLNNKTWMVLHNIMYHTTQHTLQTFVLCISWLSLAACVLTTFNVPCHHKVKHDMVVGNSVMWLLLCPFLVW